MSSSAYADVEIHIYPKRDERYAVDLKVNGQSRFPPGELDLGALPLLTGDPRREGEQLFGWLLSDPALKQAWTRIRAEHPQRRLRLHLDATDPRLHAIPSPPPPLSLRSK